MNSLILRSARTCVAIGLWLGVAASTGAAPLGLPPLSIPSNNPQSQSKIRLGEKLFQDKRFSSGGEIACVSCHLEPIVFQDGRSVPKGVHQAKGTRNAPTIVNSAYLRTLFWDGRAQSLEQQSLQPLVNPVEHGLNNLDEVLAVIRSDRNYLELFRQAFDIDAQAITVAHFAKAIAAFERTLVSGDSPFDRWYYGGERNALSESARRGFDVFTGPGHCVSCHTINKRYALFTDQGFHNVNVGFIRLGTKAENLAETYLQMQEKIIDRQVLSDQLVSEMGRFVVSRQRQDIGAFKTPTLRNIERTAPYFHDGSLNTLYEVVDYFDSGCKTASGTAVTHPFLSPLVRPLHLTDRQKEDLVAFLDSLTSPQFLSKY